MPTTDLSLVTLSLRNLLDANVRRLMGGAMPSELEITTMPPEDVSASTVTLNLHLYAVMEDAHFKNAVGMRNARPPIAGQPMALRLYYVLTPHLTNAQVFDAEGQQRAMGPRDEDLPRSPDNHRKPSDHAHDSRGPRSRFSKPGWRAGTTGSRYRCARSNPRRRSPSGPQRTVARHAYRPSTKCARCCSSPSRRSRPRAPCST